MPSLFGSCFFAGIERSESRCLRLEASSDAQIVDMQPARAPPMSTHVPPRLNKVVPSTPQPRWPNTVASSSRLPPESHCRPLEAVQHASITFSPNIPARSLSPTPHHIRTRVRAPLPEPIPLPSPVKPPPPAHTKTQYHKIGPARVVIRVEGPAYTLARPLPPRAAASSRHKCAPVSVPARQERLRKDRRHDVGESWLDLR